MGTALAAAHLWTSGEPPSRRSRATSLELGQLVTYDTVLPRPYLCPSIIENTLFWALIAFLRAPEGPVTVKVNLRPGHRRVHPQSNGKMSPDVRPIDTRCLSISSEVLFSFVSCFSQSARPGARNVGAGLVVPRSYAALNQLQGL